MRVVLAIAAIAAVWGAPMASAQENPLAKYGFSPDSFDDVPNDAFRFWTSWGVETGPKFLKTPVVSVIAVFRQGAMRPPGVAAIQATWQLDCATRDVHIISYSTASDIGEQIGLPASALPPELLPLVTDEERFRYWKQTCDKPETNALPAPLPRPPPRPISGSDPLMVRINDVAGALAHARLRELFINDASKLPTTGRFLKVAKKYTRGVLLDLDRREQVDGRTRISWIESSRGGANAYWRYSALVDCSRKTKMNEWSALVEGGAVVKARGRGPEWPTSEMDELCNVDPKAMAPVVTIAEVLRTIR